ncbi:MAG: pilus assembly protein PilP [Thermodesulfovibrionales bacterium]
MHIKNIAVVLMMLLATGLAGCGKKNAPQAPAAKQPKAAVPVVQVPSAEEQKVEKEVYTYEVKNRRDPFLSLIVDIKKDVVRKKKANPIENFDVDEIKLIAIAWDKKNSYAMITLPDGKSYTIKKGTTLGLYGGRVDEITKKTVRITESVKDYKGQSVSKATILKLREEGE